jgi:hypothetical protein
VEGYRHLAWLFQPTAGNGEDNFQQQQYTENLFSHGFHILVCSLYHFRVLSSTSGYYFQRKAYQEQEKTPQMNLTLLGVRHLGCISAGIIVRTDSIRHWHIR